MVALARQAEGVAKCGVPSSPCPSVPGRSRHVYDSYGRVTIYDADWSETRETSDYDNNILYCGYYHDWETGLYHVRHRYLHSTLGRWTSRDPIGYADGMGLYEYVCSAPLRHVDASGRAATSTGRERADYVKVGKSGGTFGIRTEPVPSDVWHKIASGTLEDCPAKITLPSTIKSALDEAWRLTAITGNEHSGVFTYAAGHFQTWGPTSQGYRRTTDSRKSVPTGIPSTWIDFWWGDYHTHPQTLHTKATESLFSKGDLAGHWTFTEVKKIPFTTSIMRDCLCTKAIINLKDVIRDKDRALEAIAREGYTGMSAKLPEKGHDVVGSTEKYVAEQNPKLQAALKKLKACYYRKCGQNQTVLELVGQE
jgi:RHS repeat-associated protein